MPKKRFASIMIILILLCSFLSSASPCFALDKETENEIQNMIYDEQYGKAVDYVNELLDEDDSDPALWDFLIKLTADSYIEETYDPQTGLYAYEEMYYLLDENDDKQLERLEELPGEVEYAWTEAILKLTDNLSNNQEKNFEYLFGNIAPLFLHFEVEWCPYCKKMNESVEYFDSEYLDRVVTIRVDVEYSSGHLKKKFNVHSYPLNIFIDRKGNEARIGGYMNKKKLFAAYLAITDFFYEDYLNEDETLKEYIYRIYEEIKNVSDSELDEMIKGKRELLFSDSK
ncbi:MAG TPA: thioredoxin family protein [bacterium]|nr:thioredoxin family protein [bacterium]